MGSNPKAELLNTGQGGVIAQKAEKIDTNLIWACFVVRNSSDKNPCQAPESCFKKIAEKCPRQTFGFKAD